MKEPPWNEPVQEERGWDNESEENSDDEPLVQQQMERPPIQQRMEIPQMQINFANIGPVPNVEAEAVEEVIYEDAFYATPALVDLRTPNIDKGERSMSMKNVYLEQVRKQAVDLEEQLKVNRAPRKKMKQKMESPVQAAAASFACEPSETNDDDSRFFYAGDSMTKYRESANSLGVRVTGWGMWKTVVVPPNMYVVHTRRDQQKPLHMGLGISFKFNPYKDSFLVVPSAMQTILINANSICKELQGILIQAYVQWIIDDIAVAYQRLDFSDMEDPMRVVNLQLREQAEATIKDKVATLSIKEVLSDKQPIIKELTKRLKEVAEGSTGEDDKGLGIRIVTVQIKEAIVSSTALWENLQKPFRASQKTAARLSEIENESMISKKELEERKILSKEKLETEAEIKTLQTQKESEGFDLDEKESLRRHQMEQAHQRNRMESEQETVRQREEEEQKLKERRLELASQLKLKDAEKKFEEEQKRVALELERFKIETEKLKAKMAFDMAKLEQDWEFHKKDWEAKNALKNEKIKEKLQREKQRHEFHKESTQVDIAFEEQRQKIQNMVSPELVQLKATEILPEIAATLPHPDSLQAITISGENAGTTNIVGLVSSLMALVKNSGVNLSGSQKGQGEVERRGS